MPALQSRQAITVKYSTSRTTGGAHYTATAAGGRVSVGRDYGLVGHVRARHRQKRRFVAVDTDSIVQFTGHGHEAPVAKRNRAGGSKRGSKRSARKSPRRSNRCGY